MDITNFHGVKPILMVEAGADGGAGGGGESTALAVSTGADLAATGDGTGGDGTDGGGGTALATTGADSEPVFDQSGRLTQGTSKLFGTLSTANPTARKVLDRAQRALATVGKLTSMLGAKPVERVAALLKFEKEVGGADGLQNLRATVQDMQKSDELYEKADPLLLQMMTETPAAKHAFVKLFPHTVSKLRELAPNTFTQWLGAQQLHWLESAPITIRDKQGAELAKEPIDMPRRLRRIVGQLPWAVENGKFTGGTLTPQQVEFIQEDLSFLFAYVDKIRAYANATPEDLTPQKEDTSAARITEAENAAKQATQDSWVVQRNAACNEIIASEVRKQTKGMNLDAMAIANITANARKSVNEFRRSRPDNLAKVDGFLDAKNLAGYLAYNKKAVEDSTPEAVEIAVAVYARKSTRRAPVKTDAATGATAATKTDAAATAAQGDGKVVMLTAKQMEALRGNHISRYMKQPIGNKPGTTMEDVKKKQYILRGDNPFGVADGTRVQVP